MTRKSINDNTRKRRRAERLGRRAELMAVWRLRLSGYRILARRVRLPVGEIDIVATKRGVLAFVEVKVRSTRDDALEAVTSRQQQRIARAAEAFVAAKPHLQPLDMRFDVIWVPKGPARLGIPGHLADAWRL